MAELAVAAKAPNRMSQQQQRQAEEEPALAAETDMSERVGK